MLLHAIFFTLLFLGVSSAARCHAVSLKASSPQPSLSPSVASFSSTSAWPRHDTFTKPSAPVKSSGSVQLSASVESSTSTQSASAHPSTSAQSSVSVSNGTALIPGGKKAGSAGGRATKFWQEHLGWWYDWTPSPETIGNLEGVAMLWGSGNNGQQDEKRFAEFQQLTTVPQYLLGFNEPDCTASDTSANMDVDEGVSLWNELIAPKGEQGSLLGSPAMCMQKAESWLKKFKAGSLARDWDYTAIHVYKPDMAGVQADVDYYWTTYGKPILVTEFGCVYDQDDFTPCSDQSEISQWISDVVDLFEKNENIIGYAYTDGGGLGTVWLPVKSDGSALSVSGQAYLDAISKY
ncbi:uncharacterized protein JN550_013594 [Neoarthrinium moseri]|uniref:uncharacterized protein n=1 Tax=Neoarthrinium moseri TaxID=1658444 RepID=UPI001FDCFB5B|nr:uncharacterized protein JN550_013594 [Neoarthrinium moseri]KAI1856924.1 hypothetical protein JN550_013594 [Neoarthrinium moseri]